MLALRMLRWNIEPHERTGYAGLAFIVLTAKRTRGQGCKHPPLQSTDPFRYSIPSKNFLISRT